ncbi:MAG: DUF445 family protein [Candidatus Sulfobium sp.]|jgi:uncharacterized membrane protein YheB (UPF0754 family)
MSEKPVREKETHKQGWERAANLAATYLILTVLVLLSLCVFLSIAGVESALLSFLVNVFLGGFIGGVTNKIAIVMLFDRKWFLPGSGVLLKKHREIVVSLADTVESHLISADMIQEELRKILAPVKIENAERILNRIIDEFRDDVRNHLRSEKTRLNIEDTLRTRLGFLGKFLNVTRIKEYEEMTDTIVTELDRQMSEFRVTRTMLVKAMGKIGTLEDFLFKPHNELLETHFNTDKSISQLLFEKINIKAMVMDRLSEYQPSEVRDIIERNIRDHLLWLEVFGVLLGMLFSAVLFMVLNTFRL